jgi:putative glutamine amidotransferase
MKPYIAITTGLSKVDLGPNSGRRGARPAPGACETPSLRVRREYVDAVKAAGGRPVVLAPLPDDQPAEGLMEVADGLLLTGGEDLDPALWDEALHPRTKLLDLRRQQSDLRLAALADARGLPVLGICLGIQEMAAHRGGRIIQHLPDKVGAAGVHGENAPAVHAVAVGPGSLLARIVGPGELTVNSRHHQAVREPGRGMRVVARAADGVIEAIEDPSPGRFFLGVQWHPEDLCAEPRHLALFRAFCWAAQIMR